MVTADVWPTIPENVTWLTIVLVAVVVFGYFLPRLVGSLITSLLESYNRNSQVQIDHLSEQLASQEQRCKEDMDAVLVRLAKFDARLEDARTERHHLRGVNAVHKMAIGQIRDLYTSCTCHALAPVAAVLNSIADAEDDPPRTVEGV